MYECMYVCMSMCMYVNVCQYVCMSMYVCQCMYANVCMSMYVCQCMYVNVCMSMYICMLYIIEYKTRGLTANIFSSVHFENRQERGGLTHKTGRKSNGLSCSLGAPPLW